jgi:6-phosphogluconolactonase (cycloisomerase 2 family)
MAGGSSTPSRLYTSDWTNDSIPVFNNANTANGNIFPDRSVSGAATLLNAPSAIWLDKASDRLYVANYGTSSILVFNNVSMAYGNTAPVRTISGAATTLNGPYSVWYDAGSDSLYVPNCGNDSVLVFNDASTINGNVVPSRIISGAGTTLSCPITLWYDATSDQLYVSNYNGPSVTVFSDASTANGNVAPARTIAGSNTTFSGPFPMWLDYSSNQLYVGDYSSSSILVFNNASTADGNIAPSRIISGASTTLSEPWAIWLDSANNRLYIMDPGAVSVLVFNSASTINGDVAPDRTIAGSNTGFSYPTGLWLDLNP